MHTAELLLVALCSWGAAPAAGADLPAPMNLAGQWRFAIDRADVGIKEKWFEKTLSQRLTLPGILQHQGYGDPYTLASKPTGDSGLSKWRSAPQYAPYRQPGNIKLPFMLQPERLYAGAAWYQRDVEVPADWQGRRLALTLERPHWETTLWIDDRPIGRNEGLSVPHLYDLGTELKPGRHRVTIRVDNRLIVNVGNMSHSITDATAGNWNGILGQIELAATSPVWIEDVRAYPQAKAKSVLLRVFLGNATGKPGRGRLKAGSVTVPVAWTATPEALDPLIAPALQAVQSTAPSKSASTAAPKEKVPLDQVQGNAVYAAGYTGRAGDTVRNATQIPAVPSRPRYAAVAELQVPLGSDAGAWDEFHPCLQRLTVELDGEGTSDRREVQFGLRDLGAESGLITINGRKIYFRATLDCSEFPLTGHPPVDVESWKRVIRIAKSYGLNGFRFHSWCPPEAAFLAADELGFYLHVECAVWTYIEGDRLKRWFFDEGERITRAYGNHPSFLIMGWGNEPFGPPGCFDFLASWVRYWKAREPRILQTTGGGWPAVDDNQVHVSSRPRGIEGWLGRDYSAAIKSGLKGKVSFLPTDQGVEKVTVPVIVHEQGQLSTLPDFRTLEKHRHLFQKATNLEIVHDFAAQHGLLEQWDDLKRAAGRLQVLCYKEEIEADLRTDGIGGFELLGLHDFPGQGTAIVGVLDWFREPKGYVTPAEYRRFCNTSVPTLRLLKRVWLSNETLLAPAELAHFGPAPLAGAKTYWKVLDHKGIHVAGGALASGPIPLGRGIPLGEIRVDLSALPAPAQYKIVVGVSNTDIENDWNIWVYPAASTGAEPRGVLTVNSLDPPVLERLQHGATVAVFSAKLPAATPPLAFLPPSWNFYLAHNQPRKTCGLLIDFQHPALTAFPTEDWQDWQWDQVLSKASALVLDGLPRDFKPIVQSIDDMNHCRRLGLLFEARVGKGRLLVCSADLDSDLEHRPAARQLRRSLLAYAASPAFQPRAELTPDELAGVVYPATKSNR